MSVVKVNGADVDVFQVGEGRDLVLLHSLLSDRGSFEPVVPALSENCRLTLIDLPGFGASSPAGPAVEDFADRIAGVFVALGLLRETDVLGNGFGGFIALALAQRHGDLFERLVLVDTGAAFPDAGKAAFYAMAEKVEADGMSAVLDIEISRLFPDDFIEANRGLVEQRKAVLRRANPAHFAAACRSLATVDLRPGLGRISNPALVVVGLRDEATPPPLSRELADGIEEARLVEIPHCGHSPQMQDPEAFLVAVAPFLGLAT